MLSEAEEKLKNDAIVSLERIQKFDVQSLPREKDLGSNFSFALAVPGAQCLIEIFQRLPVSVLDDFPQDQLTHVRDQSNNIYNIFKTILEFDPKQANAQTRHQQLISQLSDQYQGVFNAIYPLISYSLYKTTDFQRLDVEARSTLQRIEDEANKKIEEIEKYKEDIGNVLEEVRKVAAEQGVTQQAIYFKEEADFHKLEAEKWRRKTVNSAWILGIYAVMSIFIHKLWFIAPETTYQTIQLSISKVLIFSVLAFMLYLSARNFLSHTHNAIVNKHRQNALLTYRALTEATGTAGGHEAILVHAAACIYSPQPTGYSSADVSSLQGSKSIIELLAKPFEKQ